MAVPCRSLGNGKGRPSPSATMLLEHSDKLASDCGFRIHTRRIAIIATPSNAAVRPSSQGRA
jgi:hypothetical protein